MKKILFIYNPVSGKGAIKSKLSYIIEAISKEGIVTTIPTSTRGDGTKFIEQYIKDYDLVVCAGGDGTLNEVTTGYMNVDKKYRKPCAYIPSGTVNDFASSLGISKNITECADSISNSTLFPYDIGEFNGKYFNYIAGFGAFTQVAYTTSQNFKNILGKTAYVLEAIKSVPKIKGIDVTIETENKEIKGDFIYGMICNTFSVGGIIKIGKDVVALDDGKFEAVFVKKPKNLIELQETINDALASKLNSKHFLYARSNKFNIISQEEIEWTLDGEYGGKYKTANIVDHERAIDFLRP